MRPTVTQPMISLSWTIALLIGLVFLALGYGLRLEVEGAVDTADHSWLDLALLLCAYLFAFCLKPIQKTILRKLGQREAHRADRKTAR
jgi:O-antigen/teichoic acid export membrane protein